MRLAEDHRGGTDLALADRSVATVRCPKSADRPAVPQHFFFTAAQLCKTGSRASYI